MDKYFKIILICVLHNFVFASELPVFKSKLQEMQQKHQELLEIYFSAIKSSHISEGKKNPIEPKTIPSNTNQNCENDDDQKVLCRCSNTIKDKRKTNNPYSRQNQSSKNIIVANEVKNDDDLNSNQVRTNDQFFNNNNQMELSVFPIRADQRALFIQSISPVSLGRVTGFNNECFGHHLLRLKDYPNFRIWLQKYLAL